MKKIRFSKSDKLIIAELLLYQFIKNLTGDYLQSYSTQITNMLVKTYKVSTSLLAELVEKVEEYNSILFSINKRKKALKRVKEIALSIIQEIEGELINVKDK